MIGHELDVLQRLLAAGDINDYHHSHSFFLHKAVNGGGANFKATGAAKGKLRRIFRHLRFAAFDGVADDFQHLLHFPRRVEIAQVSPDSLLRRKNE